MREATCKTNDVISAYCGAVDALKNGVPQWTDTPKTEPKSRGNMAAVLRSTRGDERTLAIPAGLTHDEAVAYAMRWCGTNETIAQFVAFSEAR